MAVAIAGNFDEKCLEAKIAATFGTMQPEPCPEKGNDGIANRHEERVESKVGIDQAYMFLGYKVPGISSLMRTLLTCLQACCHPENPQGFSRGSGRKRHRLQRWGLQPRL